MPFIAYFVQFNKLFKKISFLSICDDFSLHLVGQKFKDRKFFKFFYFLKYYLSIFKIIYLSLSDSNVPNSPGVFTQTGKIRDQTNEFCISY